MNNTPRYPQRVRNDLRFRELTVLRVERISAGFQRIVLGGEALDGFTSRGFDDHSKLFFPQPDAHFVPPTVTEEGIVWPEGPRPPSRDYTPLYDELRHELAIDFFIHDGGVASGWAMQAQPGDKLTVAGPRGSLVVPEDYAYQLYVCDESGMPALRRRLETLSKLAVKPQVKSLAHTAIEREFTVAKLNLLEHARKKTTQKVNLFEKVQIPGYQDALRKIKRFMEDEENLSKSSQKIMKSHQEKRKEAEA